MVFTKRCDPPGQLTHVQCEECHRWFSFGRLGSDDDEKHAYLRGQPFAPDCPRCQITTEMKRLADLGPIADKLAEMARVAELKSLAHHLARSQLVVNDEENDNVRHQDLQGRLIMELESTTSRLVEILCLAQDAIVQMAFLVDDDNFQLFQGHVSSCDCSTNILSILFDDGDPQIITVLAKPGDGFILTSLKAKLAKRDFFFNDSAFDQQFRRILSIERRV